MPEPLDRETLVGRVREYAEEHGITTLTLEGLAAYLDVPLAELRLAFGSKEQLIVALIERDRAAARSAFSRIADDESLTPQQRARASWRYMLSHESAYCLLFEACGLGLRDERYRAVMENMDHIRELVASTLLRRGFSPDEATTFATLTLAVNRGAMMDVCATGDRSRVNSAMDLWTRASQDYRERRDS